MGGIQLRMMGCANFLGRFIGVAKLTEAVVVVVSSSVATEIIRIYQSIISACAIYSLAAQHGVVIHTNFLSPGSGVIHGIPSVAGL